MYSYAVVDGLELLLEPFHDVGVVSIDAHDSSRELKYRAIKLNPNGEDVSLITGDKHCISCISEFHWRLRRGINIDTT